MKDNMDFTEVGMTCHIKVSTLKVGLSADLGAEFERLKLLFKA